MLWPFKDSSWMQDDNSRSFKLQSLFGRKCEKDPAVSLGPLIGAKKHPVLGAPCEQGVFPSDFIHCPYCGCALLESPYNAADLWVAPYGTGNGLKVFASTRDGSIKNTISDNLGYPLPLPSREGHFAFCSVKLLAQQRLMVALQRDSGQLWIFRPDAAIQWEALSGKVGGDTLPVWSWSLAVDGEESGLCIPTDLGPVWLTVDWASGSTKFKRAVGRSVGGAVRVGKYLLAPVLRGENLAVVSWKDGDTAWSDCRPSSDPAAVLSQLRRRTDQQAVTGIPVVDETKHIAYWPCRGGYLKVSGLDSPEAPSWEFKPWETDEYPATALVELGPPYRKTGNRPGFWQLCEDRDQTVRDGIVNKIIKLDGDELVDSEVVECGQFLTTGRACFSWEDDYWDDIHKRDPRLSEQVELRFPLLQFGEKGVAVVAKMSPWEGRDELGAFTDIFFNREVKASTFVRFVVEGAGLPEKPLYAKGVDGTDGKKSGSLFRVKVAELPEISAFVYGQSLYVYFPETNTCFFWPLELMEG